MITVDKSMSFWSSNEGIEEESIQNGTEAYCGVKEEEIDEGANWDQQPYESLFPAKQFTSEIWVYQIDTAINS